MRIAVSIVSLAAALLAAVFIAGPGGGATAQQSTVTVTLGPGRDAAQTGTATLTAQGAKTQVVISIQPGTPGAAQAVHIHSGTCPGVGAVAFPLTNIVDGKSTTVVDASLDSLLSGGYAINAHKGTSPADLGVYVACGAITAAQTSTPAAPAAATATPTAAVPRNGGPPGAGGAAAWQYLLLAAAGLVVVSAGSFALGFRKS